jgi:hypothetical protein
MYRSLGYGTRGSGFYVDVLSEPMLFLKAVAWKAPLLLADLWGLPPSSFVVFLDDTIIVWLVVWAIILLILVGIVVLPLVRRDHLARFWLLGMILSTPLACLTMPHSRLLGFAGIGGMGLLAQWFGGILVPAAWVPGGRLWRYAAYGMMGLFLLVHLLIAPVLLAVNATSASFAERYLQKPINELAFGPELAGSWPRVEQS